MKLLVALFFSLIFYAIQAQNKESASITYYHEVISFLASDSLQGRATGSIYETQTADYLFAELKKNKHCKVKRQYFQIVKDSTTYNSQNIIGFVNNNSSNTILISAHYDHLGMGGYLSKSTGVYQVHNGADDNASGVALLLSLSKSLSLNKEKSNFLFVFYSGHEIGLYGSEHFASHLSKRYKNIELVLNFDMVGRLNTEHILYYDSSPKLDSNLFETSYKSLQIVKSNSNRIEILDTKWFVEKGFPSLTISTGMHIDYHKTTDDIEFINFTGMMRIEEFLLSWLFSGYLN